MNEEVLLDCPLCGNIAMVCTKKFRSENAKNPTYMYSIKCTNCSLRLDGKIGLTRSKIVKQWNTRVKEKSCLSPTRKLSVR